ncbi:DUF4232 domain-containing protein [Edaphobacter albus]|uniref:DUF4232 domain-containing protein n=1 Tax=Edaphobacter sp. 4G125 TaxID=2763071 RepID=UPI001648F361|nr:DUF4232 domain-containing protein [Edaphobacter sp. 4G125]QNI36282.1 DUF4232 domain-containing protein [Edaphobacter sp. 4G125]
MRGWWLAIGAVVLVGSVAGAQVPGKSYPTCKSGQLSLAIDDENGNFDGMSHSGTLLVLRNLGPETCSVPAKPKVEFEDGRQKSLGVTAQTPAGMHPGPVMLPVAIPVGAEVTSELRWVSGDVYDGHNCVSSAFLAVTVGTDVLRVKVLGTLCGPVGKPPSFTMTLLKRDPVLAMLRR